MTDNRVDKNNYIPEQLLNSIIEFNRTKGSIYYINNFSHENLFSYYHIMSIMLGPSYTEVHRTDTDLILIKFTV